MDRSRAHFLIAVCEAGLSAELAQLGFAVRTRDGRVFAGAPAVLTAVESEEAELDDIGFADSFTVGGCLVALDDIVEMRLREPVGSC